MYEHKPYANDISLRKLSGLHPMTYVIKKVISLHNCLQKNVFKMKMMMCNKLCMLFIIQSIRAAFVSMLDV